MCDLSLGNYNSTLINLNLIIKTYKSQMWKIFDSSNQLSVRDIDQPRSIKSVSKKQLI